MAFQRGNAEGETFSAIGPNVQRENSRVTPNIFDVFINHRGDVKEKLALPLHKSLKDNGIQAFFDSEELEKGDFFPRALEHAINSSKVQIAIFSKAYCGSPWCLDELDLMLKTNAKIIPVFYDVEPSDLRYLEKKTKGENKRVYAEAFAAYTENKRYPEKIQRWKDALNYVSLINGEEFQKHKYDEKSLLQKLVTMVVKEVERTRITKLEAAKHPVGVDDLVQDFEWFRSQNRADKVEMVGIYGIGGSGKSTLAKELYNLKQSEYDGFCFLHDVADGAAKGILPSFQSRLLKDLVGGDRLQFYSIDEGKSYLRDRLRRSRLLRFLLVLDDVNHSDQLDALLIPDTLNPISLVIVTTRDERVLIRGGISRYKLKEMNWQKRVELFCWSAFNRPYPPIKFQHWVDSFVKICGSLPLSLQVTGGLVSGSNDADYWNLIWDEVKSCVPEDIKQKLKVSFDRLKREEQEIFIDIACFFAGKPICMAGRIWKGCKWKAKQALQRLKDKCLVEVVCLDWNQYEFDDKLAFRMHGRICDFGREMASERNQPRRLWLPEHHTSQEFKQILSTTNNQIFRSFHSIFDKSMGSQITYFLGNCNNASETALLWLELDLDGFEPTSLPPWISLKKLQCLRISFSHLKNLWQNRAEAPSELTELVLHESSLAECTDIIRDLNHLEKLVLIGRNEERLIEGKFLSESLSKLTKLRSLVLRYFSLNGELALNNNEQWSTLESGELASKNIVESTNLDGGMSSLEIMEVRGIKLVSKVSISGEHCPKLKYLYLDSLENLIEVDLTLRTLNLLELRCCKKVKRVLGDFDLAELLILNVLKCWELQELPSLACLSCVESISIDGCSKLESVSGIEELQGLKFLHLSALGERALRTCIQGLQRLPTEVLSVIGKANHKTKLAVNANMFFEMLGVGEDAEGGIRINKNMMMLEDPANSFSAIIVCAVVKAPFGEESNTIIIPHASAVIRSSVGGGEWMVTVVVTGQKKLRYGELPTVTVGTIVRKRWIMTVKVGSADRTLGLLQKIIDEFY